MKDEVFSSLGEIEQLIDKFSRKRDERRAKSVLSLARSLDMVDMEVNSKSLERRNFRRDSKGNFWDTEFKRGSKGYSLSRSRIQADSKKNGQVCRKDYHKAKMKIGLNSANSDKKTKTFQNQNNENQNNETNGYNPSGNVSIPLAANLALEEEGQKSVFNHSTNINPFPPENPLAPT